MDKIKLNFSKAAKSYDENAHIQQEVANRLLSRLKYLSLKPKTILDIGSGTGFCGKKLQDLYPDATIINLDFSFNMCKIAQKNNQIVICADTNYLPIKNNTIDLIISNFTLQWCDNLSSVFTQLLKIASGDAVFLFTTIGMGSLDELRQSWLAVDKYPRVKNFLDLHTVGDCIFTAGWQEPVMDIDKIIKFYPEINTLLTEFKALGVTNKFSTHVKGLMGKNKFQQFISEYEKLRENEGIPLTWEIIYGYAKALKTVQFEHMK